MYSISSKLFRKDMIFLLGYLGTQTGYWQLYNYSFSPRCKIIIIIFAGKCQALARTCHTWTLTMWGGEIRAATSLWQDHAWQPADVIPSVRIPAPCMAPFDDVISSTNTAGNMKLRWEGVLVMGMPDDGLWGIINSAVWQLRAALTLNLYFDLCCVSGHAGD